MDVDVDVFPPRKKKKCCQSQLQLIDVMGPIIAFGLFSRITMTNPHGGFLSLS